MIVRQHIVGSCSFALLASIAGSTASAQLAFDDTGLSDSNNDIVAARPLFEGDPTQGASKNGLHLRSGVISTAAAVRAPLADSIDNIKANGRRHIIQLDSPMTKARRAQLENAGLRIGGYLPTNAFVIDATNADKQAVAQLGFITWHGAFQSEWKLDPALNANWAQQHELAGPDEAAVTVTLFQDTDHDAFLKALNNFTGATAFNGEMVGDNFTADIVIKRSDLPALADLASVNYIEPALEATLRNSTSSWVIQSNISNFEPLHDNGLHGEGQILGHMDGRVDENHCSFNDSVAPGPSHRKIIAYNTSLGSDFHGTHTAGTAVGNQSPSVDNDTRGIAYEGKMVFDITPSFTQTALTTKLQTHHDQGARVHCNSWGNDGSTSYNAWSRAVDVFSHDEEDSLVCFAVTNFSTLRTPENAKNVLAVGASRDTPSQDSFCSGGAGPTSDGRRKPEIFAPGCSIASSRNSTSCSTTTLTGTSMAAPAITGLGMLTRQYYIEGFYPTGVATGADAFTPTGALLKATLINGAQNMFGIGGYPSNGEGWGRALADETLYFPGDDRTLLVMDVRNSAPEAMDTAGITEHEFNVNSTSEQLRLTMAFTDKEGGVSASFAPVNDLDLEVVSPSGSIYKGNNFSGGVSAAGGSADAINNLEQVHVNSPETGVWTARVIASAVNSAEDQGFALVISGDVEEASIDPCDADINNDGVIDTADLGSLIGSFGGGAGPADINGDGVVDTADLGVLIANFGLDCS